MFGSICTRIMEKPQARIWLMCQIQIFMKRGRRVQRGPRKNPLKWSSDLDLRVDTQIIFYFR